MNIKIRKKQEIERRCFKMDMQLSKRIWRLSKTNN